MAQRRRPRAKVSDLPTTSHIDTLLDKEDVTLTEVMDEDDVLQQCKAQNHKLVDFLLRPQCMEDLVTYITQEPNAEVEETVKYKYPNISCKLLTSDVGQINDRLGNDEELLMKLYGFLQNEPPLNPLLASFFSKVLSILIERKPEQIVDFLQKQKEFVALMIKHIGTSAIMDLLTMLTDIKPQQLRQDVLNWLNEEKVIQRLVDMVQPSQDKDRHSNASQSLCEIIRLSRHQMLQVQGCTEPDPLLVTLEKRETVEQLLSNIFDEEKNESVIVSVIQILLRLFETRRPAKIPKDMFFKYIWNNSLHSQVEMCTAMILAMPPAPSDIQPDTEQEPARESILITHLLQNCQFIQRILDAWGSNEEEQAAGGPRHGYMGHLTRIANSIVHNSDKGPNGPQIQQLISELPVEDREKWEAFISGQLADTNKRNLVDHVNFHHVGSMPQGSVLGPLLFIINLIPLGTLLRHHGVHFHCYADDTQVYISSKPTAIPPTSLITCLDDIRSWMSRNFLKLNGNKTEALLIGSKSTITKSQHTPAPPIIIDGFPTSPITDPVSTEILVHSFVTSRIDYCNALLTGLPTKLINRLQIIQNSAARIITCTKSSDHITPVLIQLHWLPVQHRINYKNLLLTCKALHNLATTYLYDLLQEYTPSRTLRSSSSGLLTIPTSRLSSMGARAFSCSAPRLWNSLPPHIRQSDSITSFKSQLKTHLFKLAYSL
ncbi:serine/threonine-protein phosphatase 6 regulatory subunit 3-like [Limanda limanda]|uniref:serine/threonine-protein phosphatase 6 regulatory subunit 3-like n=1 Tax=Limanda limanda TaxID=27771 RepID=UPI0029C78D66|nr:serine/threonine-protein phosphatase 6 regulatory subunit 3-like [Limanda limanda]